MFVVLLLSTWSLILIPAYGTDVWFPKPSYTCLFSETTLVGDSVFKVNALTTNPNQPLTYSIVSGSHLVFLPRSSEGHIKLKKVMNDGVTNMRSDDTRRISIKLKASFIDGTKSAEVTINLIALKVNFGDKYVSNILPNIHDLVKQDNIFRPVSARYPLFKKFHRVLMQPTVKSRAISKAGVTFQRAVKEIVKRIVKDVSASLGTSQLVLHHLGVEGIFSANQLQKITALTNCQEAVTTPRFCPINDKYRTIDGTCNNRKNPTFGAAETGFVRLLDAEYFDADGINDPLGAGDQPGAPERPNPFIVTEIVITEQTRSARNVDQTSLMYMQWGQFIDHDMTLAPESEGGDVCEEIPCTGIDEDFVDPCFPILPIPKRNQCIRFIRSAAVCQDNAYDLKPREQINVNTAYLDASMVYGSSARVQTALRDLTNDLGLLKVSGARGELMPLDNSELIAPNNFCLNLGGCFLAGDLRVNEQASLASIHTLFVREHNRIAKELRKLNPHWNGEKIYQETRKIIGALVQKITYQDWLPIALGKFPLGRYTGYKRNVNPGISNAFATAAYRFGHSTVRPTFDYLDVNFDPIFDPIPLVQMFFNNTLIQKKGVEGFLLGAVGNFSQTVDIEVAEGLTRRLFQRAKSLGLDLAALNVQRGRDHGLPSYEAFRRRCDFRPAQSFDDLKHVIKNDKVRKALELLYKTPNNTDLWPAGLAEDSTNDGSLGPTFACIVEDQFRRLRDGDRFFYENDGVFKSDQLQSIRKASLSTILCNNVEGIVSVQRDAFEVPGRSCLGRRSCLLIPKLNLRPWKEYRSPCSKNPCRNGGTCIPLNDQEFRCKCSARHCGLFCQDLKNPCHPNPCLNGGRCRRFYRSQQIRCDCRYSYTGYYGSRCQYRFSG